ncbi:MAG: family 10 glycosylhydrolase, partial [Syntrophaceae bacterium]|nr:family 10 glycosylhydrolase [Syntrophaceae bacterium]
MEDISRNKGASLIARFDEAFQADSPANLEFKRNGGEIIEGGVSGKALLLKKGSFLTLPAKKAVTSSSGSVSFWVRPNWSDEGPESHTFMSFGWRDGRKGYFAISMGWWEPKGKPFLFFVANNQVQAHVHKRVRFDPGEWTHLACTWDSGPKGSIRLFVNGFRVAEGKYRAPANLDPEGDIFIGSDRGAPLAENRWADCDLDELAFWQRPLPDEEVFRVYRAQDSRVVSLPRDSEGRVREMRAIFDEGQGWMSDLGARRTVERIKRAGFNLYSPNVWHGAGTHFPSEKAPPAKGWPAFPVDPLERLIRIAHAGGIEVHPCFCVALRQRDFFPGFYAPETPKDAFDLHRPAFRVFMVDLILEVVRRYDVDGINLDFIRTMGTCTCAYCLDAYRNRFGRDLKADLAKTEPDGILNPHIRRWHDEAVGEIVREVSTQAKKIRPGLIVSVDGHPRPDPNGEGRNEIKWANDGHVDVIFNMIYGKIPDFEQHHFMRRRLRNPDQLVILLANMDFINRKPVSRDP